MKTFLTVSAILLFCSCGNKEKEVDKSKMLQSWEVNIHSGDTINRTDGNGKKQGLWIGNRTDTITYKDGEAI